jgi:hypothetical protein
VVIVHPDNIHNINMLELEAFMRRL